MKRPRNPLAIAFAAFAFAAFVRAATAPAAPPDTTSSTLPAGDPARGRKLYVPRCTPCHGADGRGGVRVTGNPTPDWRDARRMADSTYDDAYLRACIADGRPKSGMVSWKKQGLKPSDIEHLIAYIRTFVSRDGAPGGKKSAPPSEGADTDAGGDARKDGASK